MFRKAVKIFGGVVVATAALVKIVKLEYIGVYVVLRDSHLALSIQSYGSGDQVQPNLFLQLSSIGTVLNPLTREIHS